MQNGCNTCALASIQLAACTYTHTAADSKHVCVTGQCVEAARHGQDTCAGMGRPVRGMVLSMSRTQYHVRTPRTWLLQELAQTSSGAAIGHFWV